jgi:hypothetical protein
MSGENREEMTERSDRQGRWRTTRNLAVLPCRHTASMEGRKEAQKTQKNMGARAVPLRVLSPIADDEACKGSLRIPLVACFACFRIGSWLDRGKPTYCNLGEALVNSPVLRTLGS